jgi:hypothetical protein
MLTAENIDDLLEKAKAEERAYNWADAAKIYERIAELFLDNRMLEDAAKIYKKLREIYYWSGLAAENSKQYVESIKYAILSCKKGANLFREIKKKSEELECQAGLHFANGLVGEEMNEIKNEFSKSYDLFIEASESYSKQNDVESHIRSLTYALSTLSYIIGHCREPKKIEQLYQKGIELTDDIMSISKDKEYVLKYFSLLCFSRQLMGTAIWPIKDFKEDYSLMKTFDQMLEIANYFEHNHQLSFRDLSLIYYYRGVHYGLFGHQYIEDEVEQGEYIDKAIGFFEKAMNFSRRSKIKPLLIHIIFWLDLWALFGGRIEYVQKRILNDIDEIVELGGIFEGSNDQSHYFAFLSPTFYYANMAQMSFLTQAQRIAFAEKGIEYAKRSLKGFPPLVTSVWSYQLLTWSYSVLAILITEKDKQNEYIEKMFDFAEKADEIGEICEGGWAKASSLSSLYRAYKTSADITNNSEERIKMLSKAADIQKKYLSYSIESRS